MNYLSFFFFLTAKLNELVTYTVHVYGIIMTIIMCDCVCAWSDSVEEFKIVYLVSRIEADLPEGA